MTDNFVVIEGHRDFNSGVFTTSGDLSEGDAGSISISTKQLSVFSGGAIQSNTVSPVAYAGKITIDSDMISLEDKSQISTSTAGRGNSGDIEIIKSSFVLLDGVSKIIAITEKGSSGDGGNIKISSGTIAMRDSSLISSSSSGLGKSGNVLVQVRDLSLLDNSLITAATQSSGKAGNIELSPFDSIDNLNLILQDSEISTETVNIGNGGNLSLMFPDTIQIVGKGILSAQTSGAGRAGNIEITTERLKLDAGTNITTTATRASTSTEPGGSITLAANRMDLFGSIGILAETQSSTPAGTLTLKPHTDPSLSINLADQSRISASTSSSGPGGQLTVTAPQSITISGQGTLSAETSGSGKAGDVLIETQRLNIQNGAAISTSTTGTGDGGTLRINAPQQIHLSNASLTAQSSGSGKAGGIALRSDNINLDHSTTTVESSRSGQGGDINVFAQNLSLNSGQLSASTTSAEGGDINLDIAQLLLLRNKSSIATNAGESDGGDITINNLNGFLILRDGSRIETNARQGGNGGDIRIDNTNGFIIAVPKENSDITANAVAGNGGKVDVFSQGIFGLEFRPKLSSQSDITASSESGAQGNVSLNTPNVDPSNGLAELPTTPISGAEGLDRRCAAQSNEKQSNGSFQTSGRGGLAARPGNPASIPYTTGDIHSFDLDIAQHSSPSPTPSMASAPSSLEAQQIQITPDGRVRLVAGRSVVSPQPVCPL